MRDNTNMTAIALTDLDRDHHRTYLAVFADTDVIVTISDGEPFTILAGTAWGPQPAPINDIEFSGSGTLILG